MHKQRTMNCRSCGRTTMHHKQFSVSDGVGCLFTLLTGGLFLLLWIPIGVIDMAFQPWRCQVCGEKN